jgi:hypothetical protein
MQAFIAALEVFAGGSDRVTAEQLVGLTDEHREVLARRAGTLSSGRPLEPLSQSSTSGAHGLPPHLAVTRASVVPKANATGWIIGVVLAIAAAVATIAYMR